MFGSNQCKLENDLKTVIVKNPTYYQKILEFQILII